MVWAVWTVWAVWAVWAKLSLRAWPLLLDASAHVAAASAQAAASSSERSAFCLFDPSIGWPRFGAQDAPAATCVALTPPGISTRPGTVAAPFSESGSVSQHVPSVLRPRQPSSFTPHVHTVPSASRATVCMPPADTCTQKRGRKGG
eukprot:199900-Chlamydomonas_euryale.AAC.5